MIPDFENKLVVVGIDPGVEHLGLSVLHLDVYTHEVSLVTSITLHGEQLLRNRPDLVDSLKARYGKLHLYGEIVNSIFHDYNVHAVAIEQPFLGRFPTAYASLLECCMQVRHELFKYNPTILLDCIDPPTIKINVGTAGGSNDKNDMTESIKDRIAHGDIINDYGVDIDSLDEHAIDSIAIGYTHIRSILGTALTYEKRKKSKKKGKKKCK